MRHLGMDARPLQADISRRVLLGAGASTTGSRCRVAHLHSSAGLYGSAGFTRTLVKYIDEKEIDSQVITLGSKPGYGDLHRSLVADGVRCLHLPVGGRFSVPLIRSLGSVLRSWEIDILHTHGFKADVIGYLAGRYAKVKLVSTVHGWCARERTRIAFYEGLSRIVLRRFDRVVTVSLDLYRDLVNRGFERRRLRLIRNAVDVERFSGLRANVEARNPNEPLRVLFVGRLQIAKGVLDLADAYACAHLPSGSRLTILGDGPTRQQLMDRCRSLGIADRVQMLGRVDDVRPYLANHDVLVLPSHSEGIPRSLMEAQAASVPVIASGIPGIRELIVNDVTGKLVPAGNTAALSAALEEIASDPSHADLLAAAGERRVAQEFAAPGLASAYVREYKALGSIRTAGDGPGYWGMDGGIGQ